MTMKTTIHTYCFDISKPAEKAAYESLAASLRARGLKVFETWGGDSGHYHPFSASDGAEIELETSHLFGNQWNTAPCMGSEKGWRVFDWAQDYPINFSNNIKYMHLRILREAGTRRERLHLLPALSGFRISEGIRFGIAPDGSRV